MSLPQTYKHAVFKELGQPLVIEDTPLKLPGKGQLLVKVEACGVCFSDMYAQNNVMGGGFPLVPGHEIVGKVAAVGDGVERWKDGDRVGAGWHGGHDGVCKACQKGMYQMCGNRKVHGETINGGYAEYAIIQAESAIRVPDHVDAAKYAPIMCAGVSCFNSIRNMKTPAGEIVAVQGIGGLGHLAIQYAAKLGYRVVAISRGSEKEDYARQLGAHEYIDTDKGDAAEALKQLGGASLIVTTSPSAETISPLLAGLGMFGKLLMLSVPGDLVVNTGTMLFYALSVQVWPCGSVVDAEETIQFTELQKVDCKIEKFPLDKANDAFNHMLSGKARFRAVITM